MRSKKLHQDNEKENQVRSQKTVSPSACNKTEQQKNQKIQTNI